jgi:hypothetical protein
MINSIESTVVEGHASDNNNNNNNNKEEATTTTTTTTTMTTQKPLKISLTKEKIKQIQKNTIIINRSSNHRTYE